MKKLFVLPILLTLPLLLSGCFGVMMIPDSDTIGESKTFEGDGITEARYTPQPVETYVRAEVVDADGRSAWSRIIPIEPTNE
jgi:hypothetical protein